MDFPLAFFFGANIYIRKRWHARARKIFRVLVWRKRTTIHWFSRKIFGEEKRKEHILDCWEGFGRLEDYFQVPFPYKFLIHSFHHFILHSLWLFPFTIWFIWNGYDDALFFFHVLIWNVSLFNKSLLVTFILTFALNFHVEPLVLELIDFSMKWVSL